MEQTTLPLETQSLFEELTNTLVLSRAFKDVKRNGGASGIDGISVGDFETNLQEELAQLRKELMSWIYKPKPVKRVEIPKPTGGMRMLGIPCVRDRVVQTGIKLLLEPILEPLFSMHSYGFRPNRNQQQAVRKAQAIVQTGKAYVVDIDLSKFFDRINHDRLIGRLGKVISDKRILRIIGMTLRSGVMKEGLISPTESGATQGSPLSPLLSNLVLDELDKELERRGLSFCRYADDCNIFAGSAKAAERLMANISKFIETKLKLKVNREKSRVGLTHEVKFLGMTIVDGTIAISKQSLRHAIKKVKELIPRGTHLRLDEAIAKINSWYMGWSSYYSMTQYPSQLRKIEARIRRRLRARLIDQQKSRRHLFNKFIKRGVAGNVAGSAVYFSHKKKWALSITRAAHKAFDNNWFITSCGQKIRSNEGRQHWFSADKWVHLT